MHTVWGVYVHSVGYIYALSVGCIYALSGVYMHSVWCICHIQYGVYMHIAWGVYVTNNVGCICAHSVGSAQVMGTMMCSKFTPHLLPEYSFLGYIYWHACLCTFELGVCVTGSLGMEARGQLVGLHSFSHHVGPVVQTQVLRFGGRHCYCLSQSCQPTGVQGRDGTDNVLHLF